ncbi:MAG TPA: 50S ribosomal protein L15 [Actinomycetes bacterium]|nr:50S ribosomal protein L15 [Actinomycetes bacterium]
MKLHHLRPAPGSTTERVRKGRGDASGSGKTAGRGTKGSRARGQVRIGFEGGQMPLQRRIPKLRGFTNPNKVHWSVVNLDRLQTAFPKGGGVDPDGLVAAGLARKGTPVKVLGQGEVSVALQVRAHAFSATAAEKIAAAGGTVEVV